MTHFERLFCCVLALSAFLMASAVFAEDSTSVPVAGCLQQIGDPYDAGDKICIKVKNTCNEIVVVDSTLGVYNFGVEGSKVSSSSSTIAVDPGQTATLCIAKPTDAGTYCFRFDIENGDQTQPGDGFVAWHNNVVVTMVGGNASGSFEVGGSGFLDEDVQLAVTSPPGWNLDLSTDFVAASDFPATVDYALFGPEGESVEILITAYSVATNEWVGDATLSVGQNDTGTTETEPTPQDVPDALQPGSYSEIEERSNQQVREAPLSRAPAFLEITGEGEDSSIDGIALLLAWIGGVDAPAVDRVLFEVDGPDGRSVLPPAASDDITADAGIRGAFWDTSSFPAGDYLVRARLLGADGLQSVVEKPVTLERAPSMLRSSSTTSLGGLQTVEVCADEVDEDPSEPFGEFPDDPTDEEEPVDECPPKEETCGCESMEIRGAGTNSGIPHPPFAGGGTANGPVVPGFAGGPAGGSSFSYRFEVLAKLKAGSNPALCTFKQYAKRTATIGGVPQHKTHDGQEYPYGGGAYAPDGPNPGFHQSDGAATPPTIRWVDGPGWHGLSGPPGVAIRYQAKFFAMVSGPDGTCKCSWEVDMAMNAAGGVTTPPTLANVNCS